MIWGIRNVGYGAPAHYDAVGRTCWALGNLPAGLVPEAGLDAYTAIKTIMLVDQNAHTTHKERRR